MTDGNWQPPRARRRPWLDGLPLARVGGWIIVIGWLLCIGAVLTGVFSAFQDKVMGSQFFDPSGMGGWQRFQNFVQSTVSLMPMALLVVAAGFALRAYAGRVPPAPAAVTRDRRSAPLPEAEPFPDATLFLPPPPPQPERANGEVVFAKPDDELWRH